MEYLEETLTQVHDWSRDRIHVLCEKSNEDDAFSLFKEFEEWYDEDEEYDIFSLAYIGEGSKYD